MKTAPITQSERDRLRLCGEAMRAWLDGKPVEVWDGEGWIGIQNSVISWNCARNSYRPAAGPVPPIKAQWRPWGFENGPLILRVKFKNGSYPAVAVLVPNGYWVHCTADAHDPFRPTFYDFETFMTVFSHTDGEPCGALVIPEAQQ
jgi:hypothetical protein